MLKKSLLLIAMITVVASQAKAMTTNHHPVVLELFTSQGCSSCPPADALLKQLVTDDPSLLALSFHVHYWDNLGWKDPYSSEINTERQRGYASAMNSRQVFTPQLIVNGMTSVVGSDERAVENAIATAKARQPEAEISIAPSADGHDLVVSIPSKANAPIATADVWEVRFNRYAKTKVSAGENGGRQLENINNVTSIKHLGMWPQGNSRYKIPLDSPIGQNIAIIVQTLNAGPILEAATYPSN
jgi:hypothetical protein